MPLNFDQLSTSGGSRTNFKEHADKPESAYKERITLLDVFLNLPTNFKEHDHTS